MGLKFIDAYYTVYTWCYSCNTVELHFYRVDQILDRFQGVVPARVVHLQKP